MPSKLSAILSNVCLRCKGFSPALWLMHLSIVVVLCGGIFTAFHETRGHIHLRIGETTHEYMAENLNGSHTPTPLPFYITLTDFNIEYDGAAHTDYVSSVRISKVRPTEMYSATGMDIRMNHPLLSQGYRIIQASYDADMRGTHLGVVHDPYGTRIVMVGYVLFFLAFLHQLFLGIANRVRRNDTPLLEGLTAKHVLAIILIIIVALLPLAPLALSPLQPILRTPLLYIHVGIVILSYILLMATLIRRTLLKPAVWLLGLGIVLGSVWGSISWGTYWSWDPKETWSLITLILYALPLHERMAPILQHPRIYRIYNILCLLSLLVTYLGVNFFMQSQHSYLTEL